MSCETVRTLNKERFMRIALLNFSRELEGWPSKLSSYGGIVFGIPELILELKSVPGSRMYSAWRGVAAGLIGQIMDRKGAPSPITAVDVA